MSQYRKKLIEVALPLEAINKASVRENFIYRGNPSAVHKWWAQRPLAAARAMIFAQMVDDPSAHPDLFPTERAQDRERKRLFRILENLVQWESTNDHMVLQSARDEIWQSWRRTCAENADNPSAQEMFDRHRLPRFSDPFAGGGTIPLEAQRLGFESHASDLNPVAVLINKALLEIPTLFGCRPPVNAEAHDNDLLFAPEWHGLAGLIEDLRYYGKLIRQQAETRIGQFYPPFEITSRIVADRPDLQPYEGRKIKVIAWLWARTVKSPNPAFAHVYVPLASTFMVSTKKGKEAYVEPVIDQGTYRFNVRVGKPKDIDRAKRGTKTQGSGSSFQCLLSGVPITFDYIRSEAKAGRLGVKLMAAVLEGERGRIYVSPTSEIENIALSAIPGHVPDTELPKKALGFRVQEYGMTRWSDLFTPRQLLALTTLSDLISEAHSVIKRDAVAAGMTDDNCGFHQGGSAALAYADALALLLAFSLDKTAEYGCTIVPWYAKEDRPKGLFARQAIPMVWDFAEVNPLGDIGGCFEPSVKIVAGALTGCPVGALPATVSQSDAISGAGLDGCVVSTDPPYYDNIGYADLSDFFYVWLRRSLRPVFPELFSTLTVPKSEELVATPYRHGSKEKAEQFFLEGMTKAMHRLAVQAHPSVPVTIYYAFKQSEKEGELGSASTGWETFLGAVVEAGFAITGTWPIRTERGARSVGQGTNALASSIVLVCRKRPDNALTATRREFVQTLKAELPQALAYLQRGNIAPVDLAQAAIGPGMAVYTRYARVLDSEGKPVPVREALALINQVLDETLAEQEGDFDVDTRWALAWFEQVGFAEGEFGVAETLSTAKNTSVAGMEEIVESKRGKVRLFKPAELDPRWDPTKDKRLTAWEITHHLIRVLEAGSEAHAAELVKQLGTNAEVARDLAYRLYTICERKKRSAEALSYNGLVQSWPEITRLAREGGAPGKPTQPTIFDQEDEEE